MRSALRITLGLIALGLATSVLVAWGLFAAIDTSAAARNNWPNQVEMAVDLSGSDAMVWFLHLRIGATYANGGYFARFDGDQRESMSRLVNSGFIASINPIISRFLNHEVILANRYYYESTSGISATRIPSHDVHMYGLPFLSAARRMDRDLAIDPHSAFLPMTPIYRGLLLNTAFYAALWAVPLVLLPAFIRSRRARRGGCPNCGYDTTDLDMCPECGLVLASTENTAAS